MAGTTRAGGYQRLTNDERRQSKSRSKYEAVSLTWVNCSVTSQDARFRVIDDLLELYGTVTFSAAPSSTIKLTLPDGYVVDQDVSAFGTLPVGLARAIEITPADTEIGVFVPDSASTLTIYGTADNALWDATAPWPWASGDHIEFSVRLPIDI